MIILESVTLRNWRLVNDATFKPLEEGVTGLSGANGVGKSSFLAGALWALYSVLPKDVPVSGLRRQGTHHSEECFVRVIFKHAGQRIEVIREIKGKNNTVLVNIIVDGQEITHTSVKVSNQWIKKRLKIDVDAFTTAFVVRQKELDSLVKARPAERRATIERLSGIEQMSIALKTARDEENSQRRSVTSLPGSEEDVANAYGILEEKEAELETAKIAEDEALRFLSETEARYKELSDAYAQKEASEERLESLRVEVRNARLILDRAQKAVDDQRAHVTPASHEDAQIARKVVEEASKVLNEVREHYSSVKAQQNSLNAQIDRLKRTLADSNARIASLESRRTSLEELSTNVDSYEERAISLRAESDSLLARKHSISSEQDSLTSQAARLKRSIDSLSAAEEHDAQCPTCHSVLADPSALLDDFRAQHADLLARLNDLVAEQKTITQRASQVQKDISQVADLLRQAQAAAVEIIQVNKNINDISDSIKTTTEELLRAEKEFNSLPSLEEIAKEGSVASAAHGEASAKLAKVEEGVRSISRLAELEAERNSMISALDVAEGKLLILSKRENLVDNIFSDVSLAQARADLRTEAGRLEEERRRAGQLTTSVRVLEARLQAAQADFAREENTFARKKAALELLSAKSAVSDVLDEFRKDRIARIAPELSEIATSLISEMTSGRYTEVLLDDDFTPSVVDEFGNVRPVSWLSGGEESTVALALRIAIGDMLTGGVAGVLWLDEVLTSMDAARRASLLNTLRNLAGRQIIMINHTTGANDMVDKIINLVGTDDGSFIEDTGE